MCPFGLLSNLFIFCRNVLFFVEFHSRLPCDLVEGCIEEGRNLFSLEKFETCDDEECCHREGEQGECQQFHHESLDELVMTALGDKVAIMAVCCAWISVSIVVVKLVVAREVSSNCLLT